MNQWSKEEIRLTRFAWALYDANRSVRRAYAADIVVAACLAAAIAAVFVLSQW